MSTVAVSQSFDISGLFSSSSSFSLSSLSSSSSSETTVNYYMGPTSSHTPAVHLVDKPKIEYTPTETPNLNIFHGERGFELLGQEYETYPGYVLTTPEDFDKTPLLAAFMYAYNHHAGIHLRPDDIWSCISNSVSKFIEQNAELVRARLVGFEGKREVSVDVSNLDFRHITRLFIEKLTTEVEPAFLSAMANDFTTSTPITVTVSNLNTMSSLKSYFSFNFTLSCGITHAIMDGSVDDWRRLQTKFDYIKATFPEMNSCGWFPLMDSILQLFISTRMMVDPEYREANPDVYRCVMLEWSKVICLQQYGSGRQEGITGWLLGLFPYNNRGVLRELPRSTMTPLKTEHVPSYSSFPASVCATPCKLQDMMDGTFYSGHLTMQYNADTHTFAPVVGYQYGVVNNDTRYTDGKVCHAIYRYVGTPERVLSHTEFLDRPVEEFKAELVRRIQTDLEIPSDPAAMSTLQRETLEHIRRQIDSLSCFLSRERMAKWVDTPETTAMPEKKS
jgi:hypothetical protein